MKKLCLFFVGIKNYFDFGCVVDRFGRFFGNGFFFFLVFSLETGRQMTDRFIDNGVDNEVADDLDQEIKTDKSRHQKDEQVGVAGGVFEEVGKEDERTDNKDTGVDDGHGDRRDDGADKIALFCNQLMKKTCQKAGKGCLEKTNENGRRGAERYKSERRRRKNGDDAVDKAERKAHPRAVKTGADNNGKESQVHVDGPELDVVGDKTKSDFQCDEKGDTGDLSRVEFNCSSHRTHPPSVLTERYPSLSLPILYHP